MPSLRDDGGLWLALGAIAALLGCGATVPASPGASIDASTSADATSGDPSRVSWPFVDPGDADSPADAGAVEPLPTPDASMMSNVAPQSGPLLDGSCPFDANAPLDAGAPAQDADIPRGHRAGAACCPIARDPGGTCLPDAAVPGDTLCASDSDCLNGTNGRCLVSQYVNLGPVPGSTANPTPGLLTVGCASECTYDECFSDDDCPGGVPCDCRASPYGTNVCRTGSDCRVDSDCGQGGYCTPYKDAYHCHRAGDVCFNDADCAQGEFGASCDFVSSAGSWRCVADPTPIH